MFRGTNILAAGAHPDDIEFGAFATILKHRDEIKKLYCYVATAGGDGDYSNGLANRNEETKLALEPLHPDFIFFFDRIGLKPEDYHLEVARVEDIVKKCHADLILTMSPHDTHQDHRMMSEITSTALRHTRASVLRYCTPSITKEFDARLLVDITDYLKPKIESLKVHQTQNAKPYMTIEYLEAFHSDPNAILKGLRYVERFEIEKILS